MIKDFKNINNSMIIIKINLSTNNKMHTKEQAIQIIKVHKEIQVENFLEKNNKMKMMYKRLTQVLENMKVKFMMIL